MRVNIELYNAICWQWMNAEIVVIIESILCVVVNGRVMLLS